MHRDAAEKVWMEIKCNPTIMALMLDRGLGSGSQEGARTSSKKVSEFLHEVASAIFTGKD